MDHAHQNSCLRTNEESFVQLYAYLTEGIQKDISADTEFLFHYTSPDGFLGIIGEENLVFRFSQYDYLNDVSEGKDILDQFHCALESLLEKGSVSKDFYDLAKNISAANTNQRELSRFIAEEDCTEFQRMSVRTFICCFSESDDSLSLWNGYAANGSYSGFSLGLDPGEVLSLGRGNYHFLDKTDQGGRLYFCSNEDMKQKNAISINSSFSYFKVIYDNNQKQEILKKCIERIYLNLHNDRLMANTLLYKLLLTYKPIFKKECFAHEREFRLAIHLPENLEAANKIIKTRAKGLYMIPYVDVILKKSSLRRIRLCPTANYDDIHLSVLDYLQRNGYEDVEVIPSACPVRY